MNAEAEDRSRPPTHQATDAAEETLALHAPVPTVEGDTLGHYRLKRELGRGGQAVVYLAEDTRLKRQVALKVLRAGVEAPDVLVRRFLREAETASRLEHPAICPVYEAGTVGAIPFIAMRHVEGQTLASLIGQARRSGEKRPAAALARELAALAPSPESTRSGAGQPNTVAAKRHAEASVIAADEPIDAILRLVEAVARALHAAHEAGIVHRDVKPGNIMVTPRGEPVILDFGLALDEDADGPSLTRTGDILGTPAYLSPEQISATGAPVDRRADVFALGVILFELLTLRRPFEKPTREALYRAIIMDDPPDLMALNRAVSGDLRAVVETAMEKDSLRRYQSAEGLADDLAAVRDGRSVSVRRIGPAGRAVRFFRRRPAVAWLAAAILLGLVATAALGGFLMARWDDIDRGRRQTFEEKVEDLLERGYVELGEGRRDRAPEIFRSVIDLDPERPEAVAGLALYEWQEGRPAAALAVLDGHPEAVAAEASLGRLRTEIAAGMLPPVEAEALLRDLPPLVSAFDYFLAGGRDMTLGHRGERAAFARALAHFDRAIMRADRARALYFFERAHAAGHAGDAAAARDAADILVWRWPRSARAAGWASYALRDFDAPQAVERARRSLALDATRAEVWTTLGEALLKTEGGGPEGIAAYRRAYALRDGADAQAFSLAYALESQPGGAAEAEALYRSLAAKTPPYRDAKARLAALLMRLGRADEATATAALALADNPRDGYALTIRGLVAAESGRLQEAVADLESAAEIDATMAQRHTNLGYVYARSGRLDQALGAWRRAVELDPRLPETWSNIGAALNGERRFQEAIEPLEKSIALGARLADPYANLAQSLEGLSRFDEALVVLCRAEARFATNADLPGRIGRLELELGRPEEATAAFVRARDLGLKKTLRGQPLADWIAAAARFERAAVWLESGAATRTAPTDELRLDAATLEVRRGRAARAYATFAALADALDAETWSARERLRSASRAAAVVARQGAADGAAAAKWAVAWALEGVTEARRRRPASKGAAALADEDLASYLADPFFAFVRDRAAPLPVGPSAEAVRALIEAAR